MLGPLNTSQSVSWEDHVRSSQSIGNNMLPATYDIHVSIGLDDRNDKHAAHDQVVVQLLAPFLLLLTFPSLLLF
jgi:hypothetical protein